MLSTRQPLLSRVPVSYTSRIWGARLCTRFRWIETSCWRTLTSTRDKGSEHEQTTPECLADLKHELWVSRNPVRLGIAARQYELDLKLSRRQGIGHPVSLAGGPGNRFDCPADYRRHERSHMELARPAPSVLSGGSDSVQSRAV